MCFVIVIAVIKLIFSKSNCTDHKNHEQIQIVICQSFLVSDFLEFSAQIHKPFTLNPFCSFSPRQEPNDAGAVFLLKFPNTSSYSTTPTNPVPLLLIIKVCLTLSNLHKENACCARFPPRGSTRFFLDSNTQSSPSPGPAVVGSAHTSRLEI